VYGPTVRNSLPDEFRDPACDPGSFKQFLKTILFRLYLCDQRIRGFLKCYALYKSTFYLLYLLTYVCARACVYSALVFYVVGLYCLYFLQMRNTICYCVIICLIAKAMRQII